MKMLTLSILALSMLACEVVDLPVTQPLVQTALVKYCVAANAPDSFALRLTAPGVPTILLETAPGTCASPGGDACIPIATANYSVELLHNGAVVKSETVDLNAPWFWFASVDQDFELAGEPISKPCADVNPFPAP